MPLNKNHFHGLFDLNQRFLQLFSTGHYTMPPTRRFANLEDEENDVNSLDDVQGFRIEQTSAEAEGKDAQQPLAHGLYGLSEASKKRR